MNLYDDNHPLGKVENDVNVMINAALFFKECLDNWVLYMITSLLSENKNKILQVTSHVFS